MTAFIIIAAAMVLAVAALIAWPLLSGRGQGPRTPLTAFLVLALLLAGGAALYHRFSNWNWQAAPDPAGSPQNMVSTLARRLASHPDDLNGWLLLGRSYSVLQETPLAVRAYERANQIAQGGNFDALMGLIEALITQNDSQLTGRAGDLVEQALKLQPRNAQVVFYAAAAALDRHEFRLARDRFVALQDLNPPQNVHDIIQRQITALDERLAEEGSPVPDRVQGPGAPAADGPSQQSRSRAGAQVPATQSASLRVTVMLSPKLKLEAGSAPLFVFVRDPGRPGPPLAVKRLVANFPQAVDLSSSDAMIAGQGMAVGQDLEVVARISRGGGPTAQAGDLFGSVVWHAVPKGAVTVVIDRLAP